MFLVSIGHRDPRLKISAIAISNNSKVLAVPDLRGQHSLGFLAKVLHGPPTTGSLAPHAKLCAALHLWMKSSIGSQSPWSMLPLNLLYSTENLNYGSKPSLQIPGFILYIFIKIASQWMPYKQTKVWGLFPLLKSSHCVMALYLIIIFILATKEKGSRLYLIFKK